jgi:hypothetical protein
MMKAKCGHVEDKTYSDAHHGLCRKCHSNSGNRNDFSMKYSSIQRNQHRVATIY